MGVLSCTFLFVWEKYLKILLALGSMARSDRGPRRGEEEAKLKNERKLEGRKAKLASPRREQSMMGASDEVSISTMGVVRPQKSCALLR